MAYRPCVDCGTEAAVGLSLTHTVERLDLQRDQLVMREMDAFARMQVGSAALPPLSLRRRSWAARPTGTMPLNNKHTCFFSFHIFIFFCFLTLNIRWDELFCVKVPPQIVPGHAQMACCGNLLSPHATHGMGRPDPHHVHVTTK